MNVILKRLRSDVSENSNASTSMDRTEHQEPILMYLDYKYVFDRDQNSGEQCWRCINYDKNCKCYLKISNGVMKLTGKHSCCCNNDDRHLVASTSSECTDDPNLIKRKEMFLKEVTLFQKNGGKKGINKYLKDSIINDTFVDVNKSSLVTDSFFAKNGQLYAKCNNKVVIANEELFDTIYKKHVEFNLKSYLVKDYFKKNYYNVTGAIYDMWLPYCDHCNDEEDIERYMENVEKKVGSQKKVTLKVRDRDKEPILRSRDNERKLRRKSIENDTNLQNKRDLIKGEYNLRRKHVEKNVEKNVIEISDEEATPIKVEFD